MLMLELRKHNIPNVVVFYDGINDVHAAFQNREAGIPGNEMNRRKQFYGSRALVSDDKPKIDDTTLAGEAVDLYLANLELLQALADRYGFATLAVWQPVSYVDKALTDDERAMAEQLGEPMAKFYRQAYAVMRSRAPQNVLDLSAAFSSVPERVYLDHAHLNEHGNEIVARGIAASLEDLLGKRGSKPGSVTRQASVGR
jgi:lysophospholipase L1-like esterase